MATSDFGKAFRAARESGDKEFEFNGKKYNTKLKDEDSAPAKKSSSKSDNYSNEGRSTTEKTTGAYSNEGRGSKPKMSADFTPGKVPSSEQASTNRKAVADAIGDYASRTFTLEGREKTQREAAEAKNAPAKPRTDSPLGRKMENEVLNNMITNPPMKKGGVVKKMASGGMASSRADGIAQRGKTRGKMC